jgi:hypothetical protein
MTDTLEELERLLKAGTKGPWETKQNKAGNTTIGPVGYSGFITPWVCDDENAALIVAAVNALPKLLKAARRVRQLELDLQLIAQGWRHVAEPDHSLSRVDFSREELIEYASGALKSWL